MADIQEKNRKIAKGFLDRAIKSNDTQQKLLCVYDGFVSLFGPMDAISMASKLSNTDKTRLRGMLDYCMEDGDSDGSEDKVQPLSDDVDKLLQALVSCLN